MVNNRPITPESQVNHYRYKNDDMSKVLSNWKDNARKELSRLQLPETLRNLTDLTEDNLIGCLLIAGTDGTQDAINLVRNIVQIDDLCLNSPRDNFRKRVYSAMLQSPRTDYISVANTMHSQNTLQEGDTALMKWLTFEVAIGLDVEIYARQVKQLANERRNPITNKPKQIQTTNYDFKGGI